MDISRWMLLFGFVAVARTLELCEGDNIETLKVSALQIRTLSMNFETDFVWQATVGINDLIIQHSNSLDLTVAEQGNNTLALTVNDVPRARATGLTAYATTLSLTTLLALFVTCDKKRFLLLYITITCFIVSAIAQNDCDQPDFVHLFVPAALIKDFYRDGIRSPVICKLHPTSGHSSIPSNNKLLFQDELCTIREPDTWQQWLDHYFGANSTQSFYDDSDADGVVNVLEYYGSTPFAGSYLRLNEANITMISRKRRALLGDSLDSTDPTKADSYDDLSMNWSLER